VAGSSGMLIHIAHAKIVTLLLSVRLGEVDAFLLQLFHAVATVGMRSIERC